jgi:tyrosinase
VVPNEQLPSLRVTVQDEVVTKAGSITELPVYGKKTLHPEITRGKAGGYSG